MNIIDIISWLLLKLFISHNASNMTAPNIVGSPEYSPNFVDSILVSFKILAAVIIVPALEAPGIRANI